MEGLHLDIGPPSSLFYILHTNALTHRSGKFYSFRINLLRNPSAYAHIISSRSRVEIFGYPSYLPITPKSLYYGTLRH